ncbi:MAG: glycosyltransferase N-terminal domain-containing protein, partial [Alphaproteobacteria bacterium]|nr:glycosyltransferase N-terminal domain-containing protein [Alphaproteobacteria bacterium]
MEDKTRYRERFGKTHAKPHDDGDVIWFHAASIGESLAILPVLFAWQKRHPYDQLLITTVTKTSAYIMAQRMPKGCIHQYAPFDIYPWVKRFLKHWQPKKLIIVESE